MPSVDAVTAFGVETALQQPMDAQTHEALLQNDALFEQVLVDEQTIKNEDGTQGVVCLYQFIPKFQTRAVNTSYPMAEYRPDYQAKQYVKLYSTFTNNGTSASCIERSVTQSISGYSQDSLTIRGNGTAEASVMLNFEWAAARGGKRTLGISVDKNGSTEVTDEQRW